MINFNYHLAMNYLRVLEQHFHIVDRAAGNFLIFQNRDPLLSRLFQQYFLDQRSQELAILHPRFEGDKSFVSFKKGKSQKIAEFLPVSLGYGRNVNLKGLGAKCLVRSQDGMTCA